MQRNSLLKLLLIITISVISCSINKYAPTNKIYRQQVKAFAKQLREYPIKDSFTTAVTAGENKIRIPTTDISAGQYQIKGYTTQGKTDGVRFVKGSN